MPRETKKIHDQKGFSLPEVVIVLIIISILVTLALPQIISSRRLFRFSSMQRQVASSLVQARQDAMSARAAVTFRYDNANKRIIFFGGKYGTLGDDKNRVEEMSGSGLDSYDIIYGRPGNVSTNALGDGTNLSNLNKNFLDITFLPDGSVRDANNNPLNKTMFFYHDKHQDTTAFAVSVLGAGGRAKVWRYNQQSNSYVE
jgi:prepilin-type N-terminal cleavage/methylation domain-containing protein